MFAPQSVVKNSTVAFLVSLVGPGAGQFYCGKTSRGLWILAVFFPSLVATVYFTIELRAPEGQAYALFWGILFRITVFLYIFAFLDAFFTAREMTAGTDAFIAESPRVAAILNLLTRGFGYFYLGQRTLGFAVFVGLGIFQRAVLQSMTSVPGAAAELLMEFILIGLAVHAYEIARKHEREILATVQLPATAPVSAGLPAAVPVTLALILSAAYLALIMVGLFMPDYSHVEQSAVPVSRDAQGSVYMNSELGVNFRVPNSWTVTHDEPTYFAVAIRSDHVCSMDLRPIAWTPLLGLDAYKGQIAYQLSKQPRVAARVLSDQPTVLSTLPARDILLSVKQGEALLIEHDVIARKGLTLYILGTYSLANDDGTEAAPSCSSDLRFVREHLVLPH
jgi:hypothetical protein